VPVSGQDADKAALNRVALGSQTVSVFKDARELGRTAAEVALQLAAGKKLSEIQNAQTWSEGPRKQAMTALFLKPVPITKDNLDVVIDAGWVGRDVVCQGVPKGRAKVCD
jgi:D-xylose transport system substrate-binding protein